MLLLVGNWWLCWWLGLVLVAWATFLESGCSARIGWWGSDLLWMGFSGCWWLVGVVFLGPKCFKWQRGWFRLCWCRQWGVFYSFYLKKSGLDDMIASSLTCLVVECFLYCYSGLSWWPEGLAYLPACIFVLNNLIAGLLWRLVWVFLGITWILKFVDFKINACYLLLTFWLADNRRLGRSIGVSNWLIECRALGLITKWI